jgi:ubiquinone/menaquinone biosynthesis C-methylase UbiE
MADLAARQAAEGPRRAGRSSGQTEWQLDAGAPELYQRYLVPAMTSMWAADLSERAALRSGERVLDVACGTGVVARVAAGRVGSAGNVVALDLNWEMLAVARSLPAADGTTIGWLEGTVLALPFPDAVFDAVLCQLGLQFFPDRPSALTEIRRVLTRDGRMAISVFGPLAGNPATQALADALDAHLGPGASLAKRTEHALADTQELWTLVSAAGFRDVVIHTATKMVHFPSVADYVRIQLTATPLASLAAQLDRARMDRLADELAEDVTAALEPYIGADGLTFPQEVHTVLAASGPSAA